MFLKSYWKAVTWFILILTLSILSTERLPSVNFDFKYTDKIAHFIMYFFFSYLIIEGHVHHKKGPKKLIKALAFFIPFVVGLVTEVAQESLTLTREGDPMDFIANTLGITVGILLFSKVYKVQTSILNFIKNHIPNN